MLVHVIHMKIFTAIVSGRRLRDIACEKCQTPFHYHLDRSATGTASSLYGMFPKRAQARAEKNAHKLLEQELQRDVELVPCPNCHWINTAAIRQFRKSRYKSFLPIAIVILILAAVVDLVLYYIAWEMANHRPAVDAVELWIAAVALTLASVCLLTQHLLRKSIDPNRLTPNGLPRVPEGTPPALVTAPDGTLTRAPGDLSTLPEDVTWAIFRAGQLVFEPLCCRCLDSATTIFKLPMTAQKRLPVPLCHACLRNLRLQFWFRNLGTAPAALCFAFVLSFFIPGIDPLGRWIVTGMLALLFFVITFCIIDALLTPYTLGIVDSARSIQKIRFKNPAYTAILIRRIAQSEGIV